MKENVYLEGTTAYDIFEKLTMLREDYPLGDKGTIIFAREVMEVLGIFLTDEYANVCG